MLVWPHLHMPIHSPESWWKEFLFFIVSCFNCFYISNVTAWFACRADDQHWGIILFLCYMIISVSFFFFFKNLFFLNKIMFVFVGKRVLSDAWALDTAQKPYAWQRLNPEGDRPSARMWVFTVCWNCQIWLLTIST